MKLLKWLFGSRKPALNKPVVSGICKNCGHYIEHYFKGDNGWRHFEGDKFWHHCYSSKESVENDVHAEPNNCH